MTKSYSDELAEWVRKQENKGRAVNQMVFHGLQTDVKAALDAGFPSKTIWSNLRETGRIDFGYETFLRYVNRLIKTGPGTGNGALSGERMAENDVRPPPALSEPPSQPAASPARPSAKRTGMPTFKFNPVPPTQEESH